MTPWFAFAYGEDGIQHQDTLLGPGIKVPGKWQLGMPAIYLIPPIANPFCTIQDKAAKFRQSIHNGTGWSTFVEQVPCYFGGKWGVTEE